jgi:hypothetical protein
MSEMTPGEESIVIAKPKKPSPWERALEIAAKAVSREQMGRERYAERSAAQAAPPALAKADPQRQLGVTGRCQPSVNQPAGWGLMEWAPVVNSLNAGHWRRVHQRQAAGSEDEG